ncbi:MAG: succinate dehydrogenase cytochrome b subunit [Chitinophagaceae bacterium]|nr:succinate dehydrogenase cytochrome b subunit [Chitinophagaceae bacterium]
MTWKQEFISSVGKKLVMGLTGIFLILFLIVHAGLNACIWANDGGEMFLHAAHFMGGNWVPRILEIGLFVGFILHIYQGYLLTIENRKKRSVGYAVAYSDGSKWYSRSMGLLGTLILLFLIMHMSHFWFPNRSNQGFLLGPEINLFEKMKTEFSVLWVVIVYVIGCISLAYHLAHGFQSAFKTLGVHNKKYNKMLVSIGYGFSVIISLVFAMMPISFYFKWIQ